MARAKIMAGSPMANKSLYRAIRFMVHDASIFIELEDGKRLLILREIEIDRARVKANVDEVFGYTDFIPDGGLSGDRDTGAAQSAAECLKRNNITAVTADRTLPLLYVDAMNKAGIEVELDSEFGVLDRRLKDEQEIEWLKHAQRITEQVMQMACETVGSAGVDSRGGLILDAEPLTSERVRHMIDLFLLERDFENVPSIVAGGSDGGDCHHLGSGQLMTGQPVIIDIFPMDKKTLYNGDCTRTVVNGEMPAEVVKMHAAVVEAKRASTGVVKAGVTGETIHFETLRVLVEAGYHDGLPPEGSPPTYCSIPHGTGHGIGLDVHEPPLLDRNGHALLAGDVITIEPGLYCHALGGVRVEDMVLVTNDGCVNFNTLHEGLTWC